MTSFHHAFASGLGGGSYAGPNDHPVSALPAAQPGGEALFSLFHATAGEIDDVSIILLVTPVGSWGGCRHAAGRGIGWKSAG